jgi:hypothetical protein
MHCAFMFIHAPPPAYRYLRELVEPIVPYDMFDAVVALADVDDDAERALKVICICVSVCI